MPSQFISQTVKHAALPYHEVPAARLQLVTTSGLQVAGIPLEALGTREGKKQVITSCFSFSTFARGILPTSLGGSSDPTLHEISTVSTDFIRSVESNSPLKLVRASPIQAPNPTPILASLASAPSATSG